MNAGPVDNDLIWHSAAADLRDPILIAAFEGWNDAGDSSTMAARHLAERLNAVPLAEIDPERYFDFSTIRPFVHLDQDRHRSISWPRNELLVARWPSAARDVVFLIGIEPQLQWRRFCRQVLEVAETLGIRSVVSLGALLADVPHTRPVRIYASSESPEFMNQLDLAPSNYEGPTGIVGVLNNEAAQAGLQTASFWAAVPSYVPGAPSPKAALAIIDRVCSAIGTSVTLTDLEIETASYERQIDQLLEEDDETADFVRDLEEMWDNDDLEDDPELLVAEVEEFLRDVE